MKKIAAVFLFTFLFASLGLFSCKKQTNVVIPPTKAQLLAKTWKPGTVLLWENGDVADASAYKSFSIDFVSTSATEGTYTVANGGKAFPAATGKWKFMENNTKIIFDGSITANIQILEAEIFKFSFRTEGGVEGGKANGGNEGSKTRVIPARDFVFDLVSF